MPGSPPPSTKPATIESGAEAGAWFVYLLSCRDGSLYCGITTDLDRRLAEHNGEQGQGARYTRARRPVKLVYWECCPSRGLATRREAAIKRLRREHKLRLIGDRCAPDRGIVRAGL
jgi:putative endonuclease